MTSYIYAEYIGPDLALDPMHPYKRGTVYALEVQGKSWFRGAIKVWQIYGHDHMRRGSTELSYTDMAAFELDWNYQGEAV